MMWWMAAAPDALCRSCAAGCHAGALRSWGSPCQEIAISDWCALICYREAFVVLPDRLVIVGGFSWPVLGNFMVVVVGVLVGAGASSCADGRVMHGSLGERPCLSFVS